MSTGNFSNDKAKGLNLKSKARKNTITENDNDKPKRLPPVKIARNNLVAKKDKYPLTKALTMAQIDKLTNKELKFLLIQWLDPYQSLIDVTGGSRYDKAQCPPPPPSVFAEHPDDYESNFKNISAYWDLPKEGKNNKIESYLNLPQSEKEIYFNNMLVLAKKQESFFHIVKSAGNSNQSNK